MTRREGVVSLLQDLDRRSPAGFAIALHIRFATPTFLFQTYPRRWMDHYSAAGFVIHDPTVRWAMHNVGRIRWGELEPLDRQGVLERAKDFGIMNGVAVSVVIASSRSIASFARSDRDYDDREMEEMEDALERLHRCTTASRALSESDAQALTELSIRLTH